MIETIEDIQRLVREGFTDWQSLGDVKVIRKDDLLLFNYTARAQFIGRWNAFERMSRGLIINALSGVVVARPFDKFFNWGERGMTSDAPIVSITEKVDGSLVISRRDESGKIVFSTRGSFDSEQAQWATAWLHRSYASSHFQYWPDDYTFMFEAVYPANRIVVDYKAWSGLVLLAVRNRHTGEYWTQDQLREFALLCQFNRPENYVNLSPADLLERCTTLSANDEGFVATFADGQMFKFKGQAYCQLHKLIGGISFASALEAVASSSVDTFRELVPDEFLTEWNGWVAEIETKVTQIKELTETVYGQAPKDSRKDYAAYVNRVAPQIASYAFLRLDNKPLEQVIYRQAFKDKDRSDTLKYNTLMKSE